MIQNTGDIDIFVKPDAKNAARIMSALKDFKVDKIK